MKFIIFNRCDKTQNKFEKISCIGSWTINYLQIMRYARHTNIYGKNVRHQSNIYAFMQTPRRQSHSFTTKYNQQRNMHITQNISLYSRKL